MTEQPFYIGQRVVVIDDKNQIIGDRVHIGEYYTIGNPHPAPPGCKNRGWFYELKEKKNDIAYHYSLFAPIEEGFMAITFEKVMEQELTSVN